MFCHDKSIFGGDSFHAIYPGRFLALVFLGHSSHGDKSSRFGFHQELFELLNRSLFAMLSGSVDALLDAIRMLLELSPRQRAPSLTRRIDQFLIVLRCFPFCHLTYSLLSIQPCPRQLIPWLSQRPLLLGQSLHRVHWLAPTRCIDHQPRAFLWLLRSISLFSATVDGCYLPSVF